MSINKHILSLSMLVLFNLSVNCPALSAAGVQKMSFILKSPDFARQGEIPPNFTCDGKNISPALSWAQVPQNTKSLVLIVEDADAPDPAAPKIIWVHWLLYNIPATATELPKAVSVTELPKGTLQGKNDWKRLGYCGPCPPIGRHRYFHKLYALDIVLPDLHEPDKTELAKAMSGHVIERAVLVGTYQRSK